MSTGCRSIGARAAVVTAGLAMVGALVAAAVAGAAAAASRGGSRPVTGARSVVATSRAFLSPSRNISCEIDWDVPGLRPVAYCQTFTPPRSVTMTPTGATTTCRGERCLGNPPENARVLAYGESVAGGPFLCASRVDGMACSASGRAFLIARSGVLTYAVLPHTTTALYTDPASHPLLPAGRGIGWLVAVDRAGHDAEFELSCGTRPGSTLPPGSSWTVDLTTIRFFEVESNPADPAAGSVATVSRAAWLRLVRASGWDGYLQLGGTGSYVSDGPGDYTCAH